MHAKELPNADNLRTVMLKVINDGDAPVPVRNHCHRLMVAIEKNDQTLVDESLVDLERVAKRTGYLLPALGLRAHESED